MINYYFLLNVKLIRKRQEMFSTLVEKHKLMKAKETSKTKSQHAKAFAINSGAQRVGWTWLHILRKVTKLIYTIITLNRCYIILHYFLNYSRPTSSINKNISSNRINGTNTHFLSLLFEKALKFTRSLLLITQGVDKNKSILCL